MNGKIDISGYSYGDPQLAASPISDEELRERKVAARLTDEDARYLRLAGEVLRDQISMRSPCAIRRQRRTKRTVRI